jgi:2-polyprenyl-6-hydroxyphenyl methylase / 3-demethylubiquinone-9 3-methyltransferase
MKKVPEEVYSRINNNIYNLEGYRWWDPGFSLSLIRTFINPSRVGYAKKVIDQTVKKEPHEVAVLEVGCGGGILLEEIAEMGFNTTGIDPAESSVNAAILHSKEKNLNIRYETGHGENLPYESESFDVVLCCDVLEHVHDLPKVISEISRVMKKGGVFIYDTFNRTLMSNLGVIKIMQEWKRWAIMPPGLHVWEMFISPDEIRTLLKENQMDWKEHRGLKPGVSYIRMLHYLHKRAAGELSYEEFGKKFAMVETKSLQVIYMGYAVRY